MRMGLITLMAEDWYETVDFYSDLLGLEVTQIDEIGGRARLKIGQESLLEIQSGGWGSEGPKQPRQNPISLCFQTDNLSKLAVELEHRGVGFIHEPEEHLLSIMDTEGNRLYLYDTPDPPLVPDGWGLRGETEE